MDTKTFHNEVPLTLMGEKTPRVVIYKSESHKLHQAFTVVKDKTIVQGMPVQLNSNGSIEPYTTGGVYLGIAVTDNIHPAYPAQRDFPVEVTVMVEGFAICNYTPKEELTTCGWVEPTTDAPVGNRFPQVSASEDPTNFINLAPAAVGEVVPVLIR